jgi:hypothetical protein
MSASLNAPWKVGHQIVETGVAVRLDDGDHAALRALARGGEDGGDLDRMMAVIVDDGDAVDLADLGEAALDAVELGEAALDHFIRDAHFGGDADRRQRILDIVAAGHGQLDAGDHPDLAGAIAQRDVEAVAAGKGRDIVAAYVGLGGEAVGDDPPVAEPRHDRLDLDMIDAEQGCPVEGHVLDERDEGVLDLHRSRHNGRDARDRYW